MLKKKEATTPSMSRQQFQPRSFQPPAVAAIVKEETHQDSVAVIRDPECTLEIDNPYVRVIGLMGEKSELNALIDTGSPVSFIRYNTYLRYIKPRIAKLSPTNKNLRNLHDQPIKTLGIVRAKLILKPLNHVEFEIDLFVLSEDMFEGDIIIGREFLLKENLTLVYKPRSDSEERISLFTYLPLCIDEDSSEKPLEDIVNRCVIDFGICEKQRLEDLLLSVHNKNVNIVRDGYAVRVNIKDPSVYAFAPRRFAYMERIQIRKIIDDLLEREVIQPSVSPYCARVVPIKKKNGTLRLCVDLRPLNSRIVKQKYPFPIIEECLSRLSNKTVFTLLDLRDSFHQIKVHEDDTKYFSFATPDGQYEYRCLPFGYSEAPAEFQKRFLQILNPLIREDKVIVYIDDILIATGTVEQNLAILEEVLVVLKQYNFELNYLKCQFLRKKIEFLGYILADSSISLSPRHVEAINKYEQPINVNQVQRFLGLASYFRKFIKDFALKAKPLQNLLRKDVPFEFDNKCIESFELLKKELTSYPVLRLYDPSAETELHTDACSQGLGAMLLQKQEKGQWTPIAYYSQSTNESEKKYHSFELEMLAIVRAVERFHLYLYGLQFKIITDCNALVYAINKANLNPRIARWTLTLQNYNFNVAHRPGKHMSHVDALSRSVCLVNALPLERELEFRQLSDPRIMEISKELEMKDNEKFSLVDGLVYKKIGDDLKFVVPESMIMNLLHIHHDRMAHCGVEKTLKGIDSNYWFPSRRKRVIDYIDNCLTCLLANVSPHRLEGENHSYLDPKAPLEVIHIDHFGPLAETPDKYKHIFIIIDASTRFTWLFPTRSTGSREVVGWLQLIIDIFGKPMQIVSDRGTAFTSNEFSEFLEKANIKHRKIAVASPWANGLAERVNRFLKSSLTKLCDAMDNWRDKLGVVQYIFNNTYHTAVKSTPSALLFGFEQRNHIDFPLARFTKELTSIDHDLQAERERNREIAQHASNVLQSYNKQYFDRNHKTPTKYKEGDYVLVRNLRSKPGESSKLKPNYKGPYLIAKALGNSRYVITDIPGFNQSAKPLNTIMSTDKIKPWVKPIVA